MEDKEQKIKLTFETNADETAKKVDNVNTKLDTTSKETEKVTKTQKKAAESTGGLVKNLEDLNNPITSAISGFKAMVVQMWKIVTNPLGLILVSIVGSLTLLFKAFTSTKAGAEKFDQVMAGISATIDVVRDRVLKVGSAIVKFFSGDFSGAAQDAKDAVSGFGDEVAKEFRQVANATKELQQVTDAMRDLGVARSELNKNLAEARELLSEEGVAYKDKLDALNKIREAEEKQTAQELANAQKKLEAIKALNDPSDSNAEAKQAEADAEIAVNELLQRQSEIRRSLNRQQKRIDNEERARIKAISDERKARQKEAQEARQKQLDADFAFAEKQADLARKIREQQKEERKKAQEEEEAEQNARFEREIKELKKQAEEKKIIAEAELQQKKEIREQEVSIAQRGIALIADIFGKSKKVQKAAMIAESAISIGKQVAANNTANIGALATPQAIATSGAAAAPVIALNNVSTGIGIASTIASTAKALKSLGGGSAPNVASGGSVTGGGASATPQVSFQASSENQIATATANNINNQPPIQAFVVESEVTTAQQLANNRITSNSL